METVGGTSERNEGHDDDELPRGSLSWDTMRIESNWECDELVSITTKHHKEDKCGGSKIELDWGLPAFSE